MAYQAANPFEGEFELELSKPWAAYWMAFLRVVVGWWFVHGGLTKLMDSGLNYTYGPIYLEGTAGTTIGPIATWMGSTIPWFIEAMVPLGEFFIGLGLLFGVLVRLASFFGVWFMTIFWIGNAGFGHGVVNGDLMGLLLFITFIVFAAGRYYGLDALIERTAFVKRHPRLRYLLG